MGLTYSWGERTDTISWKDVGNVQVGRLKRQLPMKDLMEPSAC